MSSYPLCRCRWPVWRFVPSRRWARTSALPLLIVHQSTKCRYVPQGMKPFSHHRRLRHSGCSLSSAATENNSVMYVLLCLRQMSDALEATAGSFGGKDPSQSSPMSDRKKNRRKKSMNQKGDAAVGQAEGNIIIPQGATTDANSWS